MDPADFDAFDDVIVDADAAVEEAVAAGGGEEKDSSTDTPGPGAGPDLSDMLGGGSPSPSPGGVQGGMIPEQLQSILGNLGGGMGMSGGSMGGSTGGRRNPDAPPPTPSAGGGGGAGGGASVVWDFRDGQLPPGLAVSGEAGFATQPDGSSALRLQPMSFLKVLPAALAGLPAGAGGGRLLNQYTLTMDIYIEKLPEHPLSLFQAAGSWLWLCVCVCMCMCVSAVCVSVSVLVSVSVNVIYWLSTRVCMSILIQF
jgi:hypothetical protein